MFQTRNAAVAELADRTESDILMLKSNIGYAIIGYVT